MTKAWVELIIKKLGGGGRGSGNHGVCLIKARCTRLLHQNNVYKASCQKPVIPFLSRALNDDVGHPRQSFALSQTSPKSCWGLERCSVGNTLLHKREDLASIKKLGVATCICIPVTESGP